MPKYRIASIWIAFFFTFGGPCFAISTVTSTSCSVNIGAEPDNPGALPVNVFQTGATGCALSGISGGDPHFIYNLFAVATPGSASGGFTGSITTGQLTAYNVYELTYSINAPAPGGSFDAAAQSQIVSEFTTSGPPQAAVLSFTGSFPLAPLTGHTVGVGDIVVVQGGHSTSVPGYCEFAGPEDPTYICFTQKVPILLGSSFLIEATASVDEPLSLFSGSSNNVYTNFGESGTFTIQDSNGNAVESILVAVPEPSFLALVGLPLALLALGARRVGSRLPGEG